MKRVRNHWLVWVLMVSVGWRIWLLLVGKYAGQWLTFSTHFPYLEIMLLYRLPRWLLGWVNFDGFHYLTIAQSGYKGFGLLQAFFPLYPYLIRSLFHLTYWDVAKISLGISHVAAVGMIVMWWLLVREVFSAQPGKKNWWIILLLPTSFFWVAGYTESLFMLLVFSSLWLGIKKQWWLAAVVAALASATRVTGVFLVPALWVEWAWQHKAALQAKTLSLKQWWPVAVVCLGVTGLLGYMYYLWGTFGDPLYFFHVQSEFGAGRQETLILLPQVFWRYVKIVWTVHPHDWQYYAFVQELVLTAISMLLLLLSVKKIRPSIVTFSVLAWILPTLTGTFSSMPRYILSAPAVYLMIIFLWEKVSPRWWWCKWIAVVVAFGWLSLNTALFIQGYWVA